MRITCGRKICVLSFWAFLQDFTVEEIFLLRKFISAIFIFLVNLGFHIHVVGKGVLDVYM